VYTENMTTKRVSNRAAQTCIANREDFVNSTGSFRGEVVNGAPFWTGRLPDGWVDWLRGAKGVDYIVYSYATPIAWHSEDGWTVPNVKYSMTTSTKHQPNVRSAVR
jgi:hypothetical protein